jgi:hypothetical protein
LAGILINPYLRSPLDERHLPLNQVRNYLVEFDPQFSLRTRAQGRMKEIFERPQYTEPCPQWVTDHFLNLTKESHHGAELNYAQLNEFLSTFDALESHLNSELLYHWKLKLDHQIVEPIQFLLSLLQHTRMLIAHNYNQEVSDITHDAIKMDSVNDYLPKCEYVAKDSLLYLIIAEKNKSMGPFFSQHVPMSVALAKNVPEKLFKGLNDLEKEDLLNRLQMDWLMGSDAGLLFRLREEIYALTHGYEEVFWQNREKQKLSTADLSFRT